MRILMISASYHPNIGGVEKHVKKLAEEIIKQGHQLRIVTQKKKEDHKDQEDIDSVEVYRFKFSNLFSNYFTAIKNINLFKDMDIIHIHDYYSFIFWYLPLRFLLFRKPVYITFHGYEGHVPPQKIVIFLRKITELLTKGNICVGDFIKKWYHTKTDHVIYGATEQSLPVTSKINKAVFIGRLEEDTGILEYLRALKKLKNNDLMLEIYGQGSLENKISEYINSNNINAVLKGVTNNSKEVFSQSKYAFVSGYLAILEAISCDCLVFSVYQNKLKEDYLKLMPFSKDMVIFNNSEELIKKIKYFEDNKNELNQIILNNKNKIKKYTWLEVFNHYKKLWKIK